MSTTQKSSGGSSSVTSSSTRPDFSKTYTRYSKAVFNGRHPKSFPKQSELWYHYKQANDRLNRVAKGHSFWNVIEEENDRLNPPIFQQQSLDSSLTSEYDSDHDDSHNNAMNSNRFSKSPGHAVSFNNNPTINGVQVDFKSEVQLHYGISVIIMNYTDEVLCVNKFDEIRTKSVNSLQPSDRVVFKVLDLSDPTNPAGLLYGDNIWLQVANTDAQGVVTEATSHGHNNGLVIGSKLFEPPIMKSMQLNLNWGTKSKPRNNNHQHHNHHSSTTAHSQHNGKADDGGVDDMDSTIHEPIHSSNSNTVIDEDKDPKSFEICGSVFPVRILEQVKQKMFLDILDPKDSSSSASNSSGGGGEISSSSTRYNSRQSLNLGKWTLASACHRKPTNPGVLTQQPLYFEQDLYCLSTSQGSSFDIWPKMSFDFRSLIPSESSHSGRQHGGGGGGAGSAGGAPDSRSSSRPDTPASRPGE